MPFSILDIFALAPPFSVGGGDEPTPTDTGVYRDDAVMEDAGARLVVLGLFTEVYVGANPEELPHPASASYAVAWVWDDGGESVPIFPGSALRERRGRFGVAIEVRDQNPAERRRRLARLESEAGNALRGQRLAGATYPGSVTIERDGRDYRANHPTARVVLIGTYRFPVGGGAASDTSDRESAWS